MNTKQLIDRFIESGLMVEREIVEEIVKRDDDEIYKALYKIVKEDEYWRGDGPGDSWSPIHTLFILGLKGDEKSYEILRYIVTHRAQELEDLLTDALPSVFYSFGTEYFDKIKDIAFDYSLDKRYDDKYVRIAAINVLCAFGILNPEFNEKTIEVCKQILKEEKDDEVAGLVLPHMAEIKDDEFFEVVKKYHGECKFAGNVIDVTGLEEIHEGRRLRKQYGYCTEDLRKHFSDENLNRLFEINYGKPEVKKIPEVKTAKKTPEAEENTEKKKKAGRNEPCPCGSGKKYKKCCGNPAKLKQR